MTAKEFYQYYDRKNYEDIPLLTNDGYVIPSIGLREVKKRICK